MPHLTQTADMSDEVKLSGRLKKMPPSCGGSVDERNVGEKKAPEKSGAQFSCTVIVDDRMLVLAGYAT